MYPVRRFFSPKRTNDLHKAALPFVNQWVTVQSWHENISMKDKYPEDDKVGFIEDFALDIPESELLLTPPQKGQDEK